MKLAGDIGGTKVLLALVDDSGTIVAERRLASADFSTFDALLGEFRRGNAAALDGGCLAVAGPVADDGRSATITNLPWIIDAAALEREFAIAAGSLRLVNDFAGAAMGVAVVGPDDLVTIQAGEPDPAGVKLVVGAGTGLGMAVLLRSNNGWRVLPSEGGHVGFAPADATQARIWSALTEQHGRVTCERVISGPGLAAIHQVLAGEQLEPAGISERALAGDAAARQSVDVFLAAYGAFAGDMAMAVMARGGVYLAGGIAARILPLLQSGNFLAAFNAKAEHAALVERMAVHVVTDPRLGLRGAAQLALQ
ncbi:glucokinase [Sulfurisoma sediminicola]|uniref:Glucokinase n=1 Tax=Sulfurisoma sediminicola TaxID=1381557 RepID=A0A497XKB3_9PROT|nr:glucokinase [Sulfurisoma sediminicola]RLJ67827.1 glucokinase [Sulfurisoma sediminicola]